MKTTSNSPWFVPLCLSSLATACAGAAATPPNGSSASAAQLAVHTVKGSATGILVNAYLVEGAAGLVLVDSALTVSDTRTLNARIDAIGKPLRAVLLTHGHPDHYNGVAAITAGRGDIPVYATSPVAEVIRRDDGVKEALWRPVFGDEWPAPRTFPDHEVQDEAELVLDGIRWTVHSLGPGESHADSYWSIEGETHHVFLGDVVMHGVHAYLSDGHSAGWLANLERLERQLGVGSVLHPGHGESGGVELLDWQKTYLVTYRGAVEQLRAGRSALEEPDEQRLAETMTSIYPLAPLDFLIPLGADAVASELARGQ